MNLINILKSFMGKKMSPQQIAMNMIGQNKNPMMQNLIKMAQNGDNAGLENFAKNICKERGIDFEKEFPNFMNNFKG